MNEIARFFSPGFVITANSSAATTSGRLPYGRFGGACVMIANTNGGTQINWYGTVAHDVPPLPIYSDGSAVTSALTVGVISVPDGCYAVHHVVPVVVGATTCAMTVMAKG